MPTTVATSTAARKTGVKGIFALFKRGEPAVDASAVDFLRRISSEDTLNDESTEQVEEVPKEADPYKIFIATVEKDVQSLQQQKGFRTMRWKIPPGVDTNKVLRQCKRLSSKAQFVIEQVGTLNYITAKLS
ncbi:uncharacterized protein SPPG_02998 [Spizellomyces punctatus DAOM BR117]|uniref:Uncharacterized protein n=1 Tax=Spizellomyces punctatus (strain DAOM BR117) TaxID=645134 RepID=A0A0L0HNL6_SPIPD|nr:uncharacterized protein SPPG_02998 [Spizellomyces punctatus DAOM BR117]KND02540.1 hypothetical protein SPPG_02998 [Spizellomyces punctatus DAOM BR117]|eukprot:XP_016610579.1 hypothetical protein SPPG_02998 [Spizellomyces punctatus DAOM BR117]